MQSDKTSVERAFELARSGKFASLYEIERELRREGYPNFGVVGKLLRQQIGQELRDSSMSGGARSRYEP